MIVSRLILKNWRNFGHVDVQLGDRVFLIGPNASGKSNFLEVFRFLRTIARSEGGGLQNAIAEAGGLKKIRSLSARQNTLIEIEVHLSDGAGQPPRWQYVIWLAQWRHESKPHWQMKWFIKTEKRFWTAQIRKTIRTGSVLTETHLESPFTNQEFREVAKFFERINYVHLLPQLVRQPERFVASKIMGEPFGLSFMERLAKTPKGERTDFLKRLGKALRVAVPQFKDLSYVEDKKGKPHIQVLYTHWRPRGARQQEDQFSDGTIRFIGLFWALLESHGLLLLEEPELSLNNEIVRQIPALMHKLAGQQGRQAIVSTHSAALLSDEGIGLEEVLLLIPDSEGTHIRPAARLMKQKRWWKEG